MLQGSFAIHDMEDISLETHRGMTATGCSYGGNMNLSPIFLFTSFTTNHTLFFHHHLQPRISHDLS